MSVLYNCTVLGMEIMAERQEKVIFDGNFTYGNFTYAIHFSQVEQSPAEALDSNTKFALRTLQLPFHFANGGGGGCDPGI